MGTCDSHCVPIDLEITFAAAEYFPDPSPSGNRSKNYNVSSIIPFLAYPESSWDRRNYPYYYFSQIELAAGLGPSLRLGVNPGEFVDCIAGFASLDLYGDDIAEKKAREEGYVEEKLPWFDP